MSDHVISEPTPEAPPAPPGPSRLSRQIDVMALAVALLASALAGWALLHPPRTGSTAPVNDRQIADAKARACTAFTTVRSAVALQFHTSVVRLPSESGPGDDSTAGQAAAANARLSMTAGSAYLLGRLDPATPPPLAAAIRSYAENLRDLTMNALAGGSNGDPAEDAAAQAGRLSDGETAAARIADICK